MALSKENLSQRKLDGYIKWAEIIRWGRRNPVKFCEQFIGIEFMDYQRYAFMNSWDKQFVMWLMTRNGGKALDLNTRIPTPNGDKTMKDIQVGGYVFNELGQPVKVINVSEIFKNHKCFKIKFDDGEEIISDEDHLWEVININGRKKSYIYTTGEMHKKYYKVNKNKNNSKEFLYKVPMNKPLAFKTKELPIHPYVLGVWLGDGNSRDTRVTSHIDDYKELSNHIRSCNYSIKHNERSNNCVNINVGYAGKGKENKLKTNLKKLNLLVNKHIPDIYFYGSIEQRLELLQGLMDTDGTCFKKNNGNNVCEFSQKDYTLIKQVSKLLASLGIKHHIYNKKSTCKGRQLDSYIIKFYASKDMPCFKLQRKVDLLPNDIKKRNTTKAIVEISEVKSVPTKCIMVDGESKLYLCGERNTVTHNSTLSAPFAMAKMMLFPNFEAYILSLTSAQSQDTFLKMEKIAKRQIESFTGLTDIYFNEVVKSAANTDGFTHSPQGFKYELFNGSKITSLSGMEDNLRGK